MSESEFKGQASRGSGKSEAEIAFELVSKLKGQGVWGERNMADILDMYAECLDAAKGLRAYEGQKRVEVAIRKDSEPTLRAAPTQVPVNMQPPAATRQAVPPAPQQAVQQQQPVHAQQQAVAQAYKPAG